MHPLFAGFSGANLYAVGQALGFAVHAECARGALPACLSPEHRQRQLSGEDLAGFHYAGGWDAPGAHCLLFVKPLTAFAEVCLHEGLGYTGAGDLASEAAGS